MDITKDNAQILVCGCSSKEHQIVIDHDTDDNLVYCTIHLAPNTFWTRLKYGLRYIFGYQCRYGAFEEFILSDKHIDKLEAIVENLKTHKDLYND